MGEGVQEDTVPPLHLPRDSEIEAEVVLNMTGFDSGTVLVGVPLHPLPTSEGEIRSMETDILTGNIFWQHIHPLIVRIGKLFFVFSTLLLLLFYVNVPSIVL